jgi:hypothetical protein
VSAFAQECSLQVLALCGCFVLCMIFFGERERERERVTCGYRSQYKTVLSTPRCTPE